MQKEENITPARWIRLKDDNGKLFPWYQCSNCGCSPADYDFDLPPYCHCCGKPMNGKEKICLTLEEVEKTFNKEIPLVVIPHGCFGRVLMPTRWNSRGELMSLEYGSHSVYPRNTYGIKWKLYPYFPESEV